MELNRSRGKIVEFCLKAGAIIGLIIFIPLTYYAWRFTHGITAESEDILVVKDFLPWHFLFAAVLILLAFFIKMISSRLNNKVVHIIAIIVSASVTILLFWWVKNVDAVPVHDQMRVYSVAAETLKGSYGEMQPGEYFFRFPYQLSMVYLYSLFFRIFGSTERIVLQNIHAIFVGITVYAGYGIVSELIQDVRAKLYYLLLVICCLPLYIYTSFIYGESIGASAIMLFVWMVIKIIKKPSGEKIAKKDFLVWFMAIVSFTLAYNMRAMLVVVWIAAFILAVLLCIKEKKLIPAFILIASILMAFAGKSMVLGYYGDKADVTFDSEMPFLPVVAMGMQEGVEPGAYNSYHIFIYEQTGGNIEEINRIAREYIAERMEEFSHNPGYALSFYKKKILNQWSEPSYGALTMTHFMEEPSAFAQEVYFGKLSEKLYGFMNSYQAVSYMLVVVTLLWLLRSKRELYCYLPCIILIGVFLFSVIWEAKSRYIFPNMLMALPYAAIGLYVLQKQTAKMGMIFSKNT